MTKMGLKPNKNKIAWQNLALNNIDQYYPKPAEYPYFNASSD